MITTLNIKNIGIINNITVDFKEGFTVLTGETGAGKSLIVDSLNLIAGGRFNKELLKKGAENALVEVAIFDITTNEEHIISREVFLTGRNLCKIDGKLATVSELKEFMLNIIDIHGQQDNQAIMQSSEHIRFLDNYIGNELKDIKEKYAKLYKEYKFIEVELSKNYGDDTEKERKIDLLTYQINEIEKANLKVSEEIELLAQKKIMDNAEKILENVEICEENNKKVIDEYLHNSIKALEKISDINTEYANALEKIKDAYYNLEDINMSVCEFKYSIDYNEEERKEIEDRLDVISDLKRKYGANTDEIFMYKDKITKELADINNLATYINELKIKKSEVETELKEVTVQLNKIRNQYANKLVKNINKEFLDLEMKHAEFKIDIKYNNNYTVNGSDDVEFLIKTNVGEDFKPLTKIASGGELSRIMLALKTIFANTDSVSTMIFDEIDTGISGIAAKAVAEKMCKIAENHQVFSVTHLAIIAANAKNNLYVSKEVVNNITNTKVELLDKEKTLEEISRLLTGEITETGLKHAKEIRKRY